MTVGADVKKCLAIVKGIEAGLSTIAINTMNKSEKKIFHEEMMNMDEIKSDLKNQVGKLEREEEQYKGF